LTRFDLETVDASYGALSSGTHRRGVRAKGDVGRKFRAISSLWY
jgi:hypothetical protein